MIFRPDKLTVFVPFLLYVRDLYNRITTENRKGKTSPASHVTGLDTPPRPFPPYPAPTATVVVVGYANRCSNCNWPITLPGRGCYEPVPGSGQVVCFEIENHGEIKP